MKINLKKDKFYVLNNDGELVGGPFDSNGEANIFRDKVIGRWTIVSDTTTILNNWTCYQLEETFILIKPDKWYIVNSSTSKRPPEEPASWDTYNAAFEWLVSKYAQYFWKESNLSVWSGEMVVKYLKGYKAF